MAKRKKLQNKEGDIVEVWADLEADLKEAGWKDPAEKKSKTKTKSFNIEEGEE
jgi:putative ubiquitin-RnfH superfamily antitoxin RatB of RatAB toxin-antitoxin module